MRGGAAGSLLWRAMRRKGSTIPLSTILGPNLPDIWIRHSTCNVDTSSATFANSLCNAQNPAIIHGQSIARDIRLRIASEVSRMKTSIGKSPQLAVVLVGERKDSQTLIRFKLKACDDVGIAVLTANLPKDCTEEQLLNVVSEFNHDPLVHGIIVQLPLPNDGSKQILDLGTYILNIMFEQHLDEGKVVNFVSPEKDVDGFHPFNVGNLAMRGREPLFIPCASKACIELLLRSGVEIIGKKAVVIGRSKIVGLPTSLILQRHHATVSTLHAFTKDPELISCEADIVVSDVGIPNIIRGSWLKPGAFVIDMGANQVKDPSSRNGYRITGDVCFEEAIKVVSAITMVPGGMGPITISMLLSNTLESAKRAFRFT